MKCFFGVSGSLRAVLPGGNSSIQGSPTHLARRGEATNRVRKNNHLKTFSGAYKVLGKVCGERPRLQLGRIWLWLVLVALLLCLPAFGCSAVEQISPGGSEAISCRLQTFEALPETEKLKEDIAAHIFLLYYLKNVEEKK